MKILINKLLSKDSLIHIYVIIGFMLGSVLFYHPLLQGKKLFQSDISQYEGMSRQIEENRDKFDKEIFRGAISNRLIALKNLQKNKKFDEDLKIINENL